MDKVITSSAVANALLIINKTNITDILDFYGCHESKHEVVFVYFACKLPTYCLHV